MDLAVVKIVLAVVKIKATVDAGYDVMKDSMGRFIIKYPPQWLSHWQSNRKRVDVFSLLCPQISHQRTVPVLRTYHSQSVCNHSRQR